MGMVKEVKVHYNCDGCPASGVGEFCPLDWTHLQVVEYAVQGTQVKERALLCPECSVKLRHTVSFYKVKPQKEVSFAERQGLCASK